ncbi:hypothetical protein GCM10011497_23570 [Elstera cyanobacteriorum]|uniref:Uncharacterized protein n=1 Tax=Elstera cyanobacteriorum TaxID=2022747 RepID=A0A255XK47_9PROT|nr:hypothetical protein [Elstera cyanobacteriorum]OYQ17308.1 hypothetical protein CHR90_15180 [Elstera cyanobacteriorum]GFZ92932.1 hypothetical protein GCM10011497_23570 [Elstera cyanobacteriorum]
MAQKTAQIFYASVEATGAAPRRAVSKTIVRTLAAPLLWLAAVNRRYRLHVRFEDLPPDIRRDLGFREDTGQSGLRGGDNVRFPDWT